MFRRGRAFRPRGSRGKRRTDWLYASAVEESWTAAGNTSTNGGPINILPGNYVDQDASGQATLTRIVGDFDIFITVSPVDAGASSRAYMELSFLRTQVDDTGVIPAFTFTPYGQPPLSGGLTLGGARDYLWTRRLAFTVSQTFQVGPEQFPLQLGYQQPSFDLRVKRKLKSGEAIVLYPHGIAQDVAVGSTVTFNLRFAWRVLVTLPRR